MLLLAYLHPLVMLLQYKATHGFRDLLLQFEYYSSSLHSYGINPRFLVAAFFNNFPLVIFAALWLIKDHLSRKEKILYNTLFIVPFLVLLWSLPSWIQLLDSSYTNEFAIVFLIFGLSYFSHSNKIIKRHQLVIY